MIDLNVICTKRLVLEPIAVSDAGEMAEVLQPPLLYAFIGGGPPPTLDELKLKYGRQVSPDGSQLWYTWIVRIAGDRTAIGFTQATITIESLNAELAWMIGVPWQRYGYASEAAIAVRDYLAGNGVRSLCAHIHPDNRASERVATRIGLVPTADMIDGELIWRAGHQASSVLS